MSFNKKKVIIDTDCGLDDAMAIMIASECEEADIIAITCVHGNTTVDNVAVNVCRTLETCGDLQVPIYKGAGLPILGHFSLADSTSFHGKDGFGDVEGLPIPNTVNTLIQKDHAVDKLISLARLFPGEITLIAMAPLTNIALAIRKDPSFSKNIRELVLMGGNSQGEGNITVSAEANFYIDPEAAYIVLNEMQSPIAMVPWELCIRQYIDWDWRDKLLESPSKKAKLMKTIEHGIREKSDFTGYILCDQFAVIAALKPDMVKVKNGPFHVSVELFGHYTRGQAIIDKHDKLKARKNVQIIEEFQMEDLKHLLTTVFA